MGKLRRNKVIISMLLIIITATIVVIVFFAQDWSSKKRIKSIEVSGNILLSDEEITSQFDPYIINADKDSINMVEIADSLKINPYIKEAFISMSGSDKLRIEIIERKPLAYLIHDNGVPVYVDSDLNLFDYRPERINPDIPIIRNILSNDQIDSSSLNKALYIINEMKAYDSRIYSNVSEIIYDKNSKEFYLTYTGKGTKIIFGGNDNLNQKFSKLSKIIDLIHKDRQLYQCKHIDLRWNNQIVVRS